MPSEDQPLQQRTPALTGIITLKLGKGVIFTSLALAFWALSDNNLPLEFSQLLQTLHIDGKRQFYMDLATRIANVKEVDVLWVAGFTLAYGLLSLTEGLGLIYRQGWASWLAMAESAIFLPAEISKLAQHFSFAVLAILIINIFIVVYLFRNRNRLFHHIHFHRHSAKV